MGEELSGLSWRNKLLKCFDAGVKALLTWLLVGIGGVNVQHEDFQRHV